MLSKLQQESEILTLGLEEAMGNIMLSLPRAIREVERLDSESSNLVANFSNLSEIVQYTFGDDDEIISLQRLNNAKRNLNSTLMVLEKSTDWNRLVADVEKSFSSADIAGVSTGVRQLKNSLDLLQGMPHGDQREELLNRMEQRLESHIGPSLHKALQEAFSSGEEMSLVEHVRIFSNLGRLNFLYQEYASAIANLIDMEAIFENNHLKSAISQIFDKFSSVLSNEIPRSTKIFGDEAAGRVLMKAISEFMLLLSPILEPSLGKSIEQVSQTYVLVFTNIDQIYTRVKKATGDFNLHDETAEIVSHALLPFAPYMTEFKTNLSAEMQEEFSTKVGIPSKRTLINILNDPFVSGITEKFVVDSTSLCNGCKIEDLLDAINLFYSNSILQMDNILKQSYRAPLISDFKVISSKSLEEQLFSQLQLLQSVSVFADRLQITIEEKLAASIASIASGILNLDDDIISFQAMSSISDRPFLEQVVENPRDVTINRFTATFKAVSLLIERVQISLFEMMLGPVLYQWQGMEAMKLWSLEDESEMNQLEETDEKPSSFGGPLQYMTKVTKHLITLVEVLEPFASATVSVHMQPTLHILGKETRTKLESAMGWDEGARVLDFHQEAPDVSMEDVFSPKWLNMISFGASTALLLRVAQIPKLGALGARQLESDLNSFENAVAMIASSDPMVEICRKYLPRGVQVDEQTDTRERTMALVLTSKRNR